MAFPIRRKRPVRTRMRGVVGAGGSTPPATRLGLCVFIGTMSGNELRSLCGLQPGQENEQHTEHKPSYTDVQIEWPMTGPKRNTEKEPTQNDTRPARGPNLLKHD